MKDSVKHKPKFLQISEFQGFLNPLQNGQFDSNFICVLVIQIPTMCENFKSCGAVLDIASFFAFGS